MISEDMTAQNIIRDALKNSKVYKILSQKYEFLKLPPAARIEYLKDDQGMTTVDPGPREAIEEAVEWICRAQDFSLHDDGGVARHYSLLTGWSSSYPETTGYIIPTLFDYAQKTNNNRLRKRAKRMLDWLVDIQLPNGAFKGGMIDQEPNQPVVFNTGQILLGLVSGVIAFGEAYRQSMIKAADWLVSVQDSDGCWRKFSSPFAAPGEKVYDTHVAWGLFEAARLAPEKDYAKAALNNVRWALSRQHENGWFEKCCIADQNNPITHTIGYALRGIIEAYRFTKDHRILECALKSADGLLSALQNDGHLPGRLNSNWEAAVPWVCLTGSVQIALCWLMLYEITGIEKYRKAACNANSYVRRTMKTNGQEETRGGIKGSFPVSGGYCPYEYINWACKFFIDANMAELSMK